MTQRGRHNLPWIVVRSNYVVAYHTYDRAATCSDHSIRSLEIRKYVEHELIPSYPVNLYGRDKQFIHVKLLTQTLGPVLVTFARTKLAVKTTSSHFRSRAPPLSGLAQTSSFSQQISPVLWQVSLYFE